MLFPLYFLSLAIANKVYFEEHFNNPNFEDKWVYPLKSPKAQGLGKFAISSGKFYGDEKINKGLQTTEDSKYYSLVARLDSIFDNTGKQLVFQFSVKHEQLIDCGGGYLKLLPSDVDPNTFDSESKYYIMFGPDICGSDRKVHFIINYDGKNHLWKKNILAPSDDLTHLYTLVLNSDQSYEVYIDGEQSAKGTLFSDWSIVALKQIPDPNDKKPEDWVDIPQIDDPEDKKPDTWIEDLPEKIADPKSKKPEDWDDVQDGEWNAPLIDNPDYRPKWTPGKIPNPSYKGPWKAALIDNPEYKEIADIYRFKDIGYVGIEVWQVKSGTIFDNILLTDDQKYAEKVATVIFEEIKEAEKKARDEWVEKNAPAKSAEKEIYSNEKDSKDQKENKENDFQKSKSEL